MCQRKLKNLEYALKTFPFFSPSLFWSFFSRQLTIPCHPLLQLALNVHTEMEHIFIFQFYFAIHGRWYIINNIHMNDAFSIKTTGAFMHLEVRLWKKCHLKWSAKWNEKMWLFSRGNGETLVVSTKAKEGGQKRSIKCIKKRNEKNKVFSYFFLLLHSLIYSTMFFHPFSQQTKRTNS